MVYPLLLSAKDKNCLFALLVDPDKYTASQAKDIGTRAQRAGVDLILLGGSLLRNKIDETAIAIKSSCTLPLVLFPGNSLQFCSTADAILLLSLISGRNAEFLIGNHVQVAMQIKASQIEVIPTGYMLIDGGISTSVQYMSNTNPIPANKTDIAVATAVAGEQLGLKTIYLEAGSGAVNPISFSTIEQVRANINLPIIIGGGLRTPSQVRNAKMAGASMVVVGNVIEDDPNLLEQLVGSVK
jgi:putative glycerol-1-phosphate prenyltransferase